MTCPWFHPTPAALPLAAGLLTAGCPAAAGLLSTRPGASLTLALALTFGAAFAAAFALAFALAFAPPNLLGGITTYSSSLPSALLATA